MNTKQKSFTSIEIEQIILMAWADTISFETITREWGLTPNELMQFMRRQQTPNTYRRWRARVEGRRGAQSKHEALSKISSRRLKLEV